MSNYWKLEPEVAGELGEGSVLDASIHPPKVFSLQYLFTGWLGNDLLESFPCYIVTESLAIALSSTHCTGFQFDVVDVVISDEFIEMYPDLVLPNFRWLKITGEAGVDDFGISENQALVVSDAAFSLLQQYKLSECDMEQY